MQLQHPHGRRRRSRQLSSSDRMFAITTLAGLGLMLLSWSYFHSHLIKEYPADLSLEEGESLGQQGAAGLHVARSGGGGKAPGTESRIAAAAGAGAAFGQYIIYGRQPLGGGDAAFCEAHFGLDWVRAWNRTARAVCAPSASAAAAAHAAGGDSGGRPLSTITCRSPDPDEHLPAASAPHLLCDVANMWMDPGRMSRARCPKHRPGYLCGGRTYHHYEPGAWGAFCDWPGFSLDAFSKDHMRDIFGGFAFQPEELPDLEGAQVEDLPTLFVTREASEHANVYHTLTDLLNVHITLLMLGWQSVPRQVVVLDAHRRASLDLLWPVVAAGGGREALAQAGGQESPWLIQVGGRRLAWRVEDFERPVLFRRAAFVPPGYASLLFAHLYEDSSCQRPTPLFRGFQEFMLAPFGLGSAGSGSAAGAGSVAAATGPLSVRLVSRRPGKAKRKMARQIANEEELLGALRRAAAGAAAALGRTGGGAAGDGAAEVSGLDLSQLSLPQQLEVVSRTDVLVAMHGAALAWVLLLPPHAAVVELWPQAAGVWRCYEHFSRWAGLLYRRLANADPARVEAGRSGDRTTVDAAALQGLVEELLPLVAARKEAAAGVAAGELEGGGPGAGQQRRRRTAQ